MPDDLIPVTFHVTPEQRDAVHEHGTPATLYREWARAYEDSPRYAVEALACAAVMDLPRARVPVTFDVEPGTPIAHPDEVSGCTLIGWTRNDSLVYEGPNGDIHDDYPDGWYVVMGER